MPRLCIFCGGKPVTKEHIFGLWLSPLFPPPPGKRIFVDSARFVEEQPINQPRRFPVNIDLQVRQVCLSCNNGWMSKMEEDVLGIIPSIHNGKKRSMSIEEQDLVASWATKTAVTIQYLSTNPLVPEYRRRWLFNHHTPPPDTCIWIARYDGDGIVTALSKNLIIKGNPKPVSFPDGQAIFFSIGSLFFIVLSLYLKNVGVRAEFPTSLVSHLFCIWPNATQPLSWPTQGLDDSLKTELYNLNWGEMLWFHQLPPHTKDSLH